MEISSRSIAHRINSWLRDFRGLTPERVEFYSGVLLVAYLAAAIGQLFHCHGLIFKSGAGIGGDFVSNYAASLASLKGDSASVYDIHQHSLREGAILGKKNFGLMGFYYPPMFLLIVLPLSLMPFVASWVVFESATLAGYLAVIQRIAPVRPGLWLAITFPAVIINFMCGQNGFLTTALMGGGLLLLERWPLFAGFVFGLMAYKPQFAVLIPLALIVARQWRALVGTAVSAILFAAVSVVVFGSPAWEAFIRSATFTQKIVLERGGITFSTMQTMFGAIRMWDGSVALAYMFQAAIALYAAAAVVWVWQSRGPFAFKAATLAVGSLMVSPFVMQYDLVLLALPIAWLGMEGFEHGFLPYEKTVLAAAWILPRITLAVTQTAKIPIAPIVMVVLMTAILRRAKRSQSSDLVLSADQSGQERLAGAAIPR